MSKLSELSAAERAKSSSLQALNPDLPGLFVFRDGCWIAHCNLKRGTGAGRTPELAVADMREYMREAEV